MGRTRPFKARYGYYVVSGGPKMRIYIGADMRMPEWIRLECTSNQGTKSFQGHSKEAILQEFKAALTTLD